MNETEVLTRLRLPARLDVRCTAAVLGFQPSDIPILVRAGLLDPLGHGRIARNAQKYFALVAVEERARDSKWLAKATTVIAQHQQKRNARYRVAAGL